jgi:hypothetical protein
MLHKKWGVCLSDDDPGWSMACIKFDGGEHRPSLRVFQALLLDDMNPSRTFKLFSIRLGTISPKRIRNGVLSLGEEKY